MSSTSALFGAIASKGAIVPGRKSGSISKCQLETIATRKQMASKPDLYGVDHWITLRLGDALSNHWFQIFLKLGILFTEFDA